MAFGLVMVLSSSFVTEISSDSSPFGVFLRQSLYAIIGIPLLLLGALVFYLLFKFLSLGASPTVTFRRF